MKTTSPKENTMWNRIASKTYQHSTGIVIRYRHNNWDWEIVGGAEDGNSYQTLTVAKHYATR